MLNYMTLGFRGSKNNTTDTIIDFEVRLKQSFKMTKSRMEYLKKITGYNIQEYERSERPSDYSRLNYIPLGLQPAFMDFKSVFDVFGKATRGTVFPFLSI